LEITLNKKNNTEGLIKIKLSQSDYQPQVEEKLKEYARKANLKGFRQGKVPAGVIKKMFGKSVLADEINHILSHKLTDYIKENKLQVIGEPLPNTAKANTIDWDTQTDFEFEYELGMVEEFSPEVSAKVKVNGYRIAVSDAVVQETLEDLRKRFGKVSYPETSETGDNLFGELLSEDGSFKKESIMLPTDKIIAKEQKKFIGLAKESTVSFIPAKSFEVSHWAEIVNVSTEEAQKHSGNFALKITTISRVEPATVNQELFDRVFGKGSVSDEEGFLKKIKETIESNYQRETEHFLDHHIEDYYIANTRINLPENFLKTWLKATSKGEITDEVLGKEFAAYVRSKKWDLVKGKIADQQKIHVETEEVKSRAKELIISQFGGPAIAEQLQDKLDAIADNYLSHENGQNFMKLYNLLRHERIMKHIREQITIAEKSVTLDEFRKIVKEHTH
jgi:trigger factor